MISRLVVGSVVFIVTAGANTSGLADEKEATDAANCARSQQNLQLISIALHKYHQVAGNFPPAAYCSEDGEPLLSWRVSILPYVGEEKLFKQFKLNERWDSDHNKKLALQMPAIFQLPGDKAKYQSPSTYYQAFVGARAAFEPKGVVRVPDILDGLSNTIWLAEAKSSVPWTKPEDISYDWTKAPPKLGNHFGNRHIVVMMDCTVYSVSQDLKEEVWHVLIMRNDGMIIPTHIIQDGSLIDVLKPPRLP
jgi:hypothetical protein